MLIELKGHVNEQGKMEIIWPNDLPTGEVRVLLEFIDPAIEEADEALWQAQFARSPKVIDFLIQEALDEEAAGLTDDWDPETEPDKP